MATSGLKRGRKSSCRIHLGRPHCSILKRLPTPFLLLRGMRSNRRWSRRCRYCSVSAAAQRQSVRTQAMQPPKSDICVICGTRPASTSEHVPPRGFFKGTTGQFRTVPACSTCNNANSEDDEELRNYVSAQVGKQTPGAKELWEKGAHKSLSRSEKLRSKLLSTTHEVEVLAEDGSKIRRLAFMIPVSLYQRVFERVTRGLYFWHTEHILPASTPVQIFLFESVPDLAAPEFQILDAHSVAEDAFEYRFSIDSEDPKNSVWLYTVHRLQWIQASTGALVEEAF